MFGSSSPFGASTPSPFGGATTSSYPFGSTPPANPFGTSQASPFGAKPFGGASFGGQTGSSIFGSGTATSVFGSSQAGSFGATAPSFGASTSAPFGGTQFGGTSVFGQKPASPFGSFGTTTPSQVNPFGTPAFGQTQPAFGTQSFGTSPAFGSSSPAFGATATPTFGTSSGAFAASSTPAFGAAAAPVFGSSTPAFGSTTGFGQSAPAFGASTSSAFGSMPVFGAGSTSPFGVQSASAFGAATTSPTFGSSAFAATAFGGRVGTRVSPYASTNDPESSVGQVGKFMSISAMPAYKNKSPEELRWEDYQAKDKGGPSSTAQPAPGGSIFGVTQPTAPASPFGGSTQFGQTSPFASVTASTLYAPSLPAFGASTTPTFATGATTFGATFGTSTSPFASQPLPSGLGSSSSAFGISGVPFGGSTPAFSSGAFGASTAFGGSMFSSSSRSVFGPSPSITFGASASTPSFASSQGFVGCLFGTQSSPSIFPGSSTPAFGVSSPAFGAPSGPSFGMTSLTTPSSIFSQSKAAGLASSSPSSLLGPFGIPGPTSGALSFPQTFAVTPQPGGSIFGGGSPAPPFAATTFNQQPLQSVVTASPVPVGSPFGNLPAMPQMSIARSAGSGPSVQYGISSMPVSDKPAQVRTTSLLTPRHVPQRSKVRLHARRYHPKKDGPKVSLLDDGEEALSTPKADVLFVPRDNPRALFVRPQDQPHASPSGPAKYGADAREMATPAQKARVESQETEFTNGEGQASCPSPDTDAALETSVVHPKFQKSGTKQNGVLEEHAHRGNGYISITGHRAGEAAIAYEHGADIEALMPKLRHSDYYTEPRIQELAAKERAEPGYCRRVMDFVVGRRQYGSVKFLGETDIRRLDLEGIVQFNKCEVLVYMDESKKPPVGQGLNKPAEVTLLNVKCVDKRTGQQYVEGPEADKFEKKLKRKTEEQGAEFTSYNRLKGEWTFRVKHFSRYGLDVSHENESWAMCQKDATDLAENELMEVVEIFHRSIGYDQAQIPAMKCVVSNEVDNADEFELGKMQASSIQSALPRSVPFQLRLGPVDMNQMWSLFFPFADLGVLKSLCCNKSAEVLRTSKFRHPAEEGSLPYILGRRKRISQMAGTRQLCQILTNKSCTKLRANKVLPELPPFVSATGPLSLAGKGRSSTLKSPSSSGFNLEARSNVDGKFNHA